MNGLLPTASGEDVLGVVAAQLGAGAVAAAPAASHGGGRDRTFADNASFWADVVSESLWPGAIVRLDHFLVSEWVPLRPGLFHDPQAEAERAQAEARVLSEGRL